MKKLLVAFFVLFATPALAQFKVTPDAINGCQFLSAPLTLQNGQAAPFQCDASGNLKTSGGGGGSGGVVTNAGTFPVQNTQATPAGTNTIGKVGIDQTTPGTTNGVVNTPATAALGPSLGVAAAQGVVQQDGITQTLSASSAAVLTNATYPTGAIPTAGFASAGLVVSGGTGNLVTLEQSNDQVTWLGTAITFTSNTGNTSPSFANGLPLSGISPINFAYVRIRVSTYGTGTVTAVVTMKVTNLPALATYATLANSIPTGFNFIGQTSLNTSTTNSGVNLFARIPNAGTTTAPATTNATLLKNTMGRVYKLRGCNYATNDLTFHLTNLATAPTPGTTAVQDFFTIPASATAGKCNPYSFDFSDIGEYFSLGIGYWVSQLPADADTTAPAATGAYSISVGYQ